MNPSRAMTVNFPPTPPQANPTALCLSGVMMLRHMNLQEQADKIEKAILGVISEGKVITGDLGGSARCSEFTNLVCERIAQDS